jgi:hypothetical protein
MELMDESISNTVEIGINIKWNDAMRRYIWTFEGPGVDPATGNFKLPAPGKTAIIYALDAECSDSYQLIYVNLDPENCATYEIEHVHVHQEKNSITIIDRNSFNYTRTTPFCLRLVARMTNNIGSGFLSPDPQVTNSPNPPVAQMSPVV